MNHLRAHIMHVVTAARSVQCSNPNLQGIRPEDLNDDAYDKINTKIGDNLLGTSAHEL